MQNFTPLEHAKFLNPDKARLPHVAKPVPPQKAIVKRPSLLPTVIFSLTLVVTVGLLLYFYRQYRRSQTLLAEATIDNSKPLVELVGKLVVLPQNETPTIATITDQGQLPNQPFFRDAQNGDKILVYTNAKKAILYRPSINKIVEVAPVSEPAPDQFSQDVSGASTSSADIESFPNPTGSGRIIYQAETPTPEADYPLPSETN